MPETNCRRLHFRFDWKASLLVLLFLPLLLGLGFWQLDRAEQKQQLQLLFQERQNAGPVLLEQLSSRNDLRYQPVIMRGSYLNDKAILLDNRIYQGRFGYEIITPFLLESSELIVLINRGWLKGDVSRRTLPEIAPIEASVELLGEVHVPQGELIAFQKPPSLEWPYRVQSVDVSALQDQFSKPLFPYTVRLNEGSPGHFQSNWVVVNLQPEKHIGYAVQWFAMSVTLLIIAFLANSNCWALIKARKQSNNQEV